MARNQTSGLDLVPWQRVGVYLDHPMTAEVAIQRSGMDYPVEKRRLRAVMKGRLQIDVPNNFATIRMDNHRPLGVVENRYEVVQNIDAFRFFDPLVDRSEAIYETAGVVDGGAAIWLLAKLPGYLRIGKRGDEISKYLLLLNSHTGIWQIRVRTTAIRVVCKNSLSLALRGSDELEVKIRHTASAGEKLEEAHKLLGIWNALYQELGFILNRMAYKQVNSKQMKQFTEQLIPANPEAENHTRTQNMRNRVLELVETGIGADAHKGSAFGLLNAVTELVDHQDSKDWNKALKNIWWGSGHQLKKRAFQLSTDFIKN